MKQNKLVIAAAGSGKTTYLIKEAINKSKEGRVLITTYTDENKREIERKFIEKFKCIPSFVKVQTWFSFLIQHGVKPYQGTFNPKLSKKEIAGMILNDGSYGIKFKKIIRGREIKVPFSEAEEFEQHYFTKSGKIYSDRLPKFVVKSNIASDGEVINRISRIYKYIFVDEVQDLAGYDLEILKLLFQSQSDLLLVGDPRQVTYLTHHEKKYEKYKDGKIKEFILNECKKKMTVDIDEALLRFSHRNNKEICEYSCRLYPQGQFGVIEPCNCHECRNPKQEFEGIFLIKKSEVEDYLKRFNPMQLRYNNLQEVNPNFKAYNFGESKGKTFERVLIYPTNKMVEWIFNNNTVLPFSTRAKLYVAITRAKYSVAFVLDHNNSTLPDGIKAVYSTK